MAREYGVSTPTGSTAYNLSVNGPILAPSVDALVVTPVCSHLLTLRPMVVRGDAEVVIGIEGVPDQTVLTMDGQQARTTLDELGEYATGRNPMGYTETDVPRLIHEVRAEKPRRRRVRPNG